MYKKKYLEYKKKYIKLQNQIGGNSINLSGPVTVDYYKNTELNKKFIILGDIHGDFMGSCTNNDINIVNYLDDIFKTKIKLDFFIEYPVKLNQDQLLNGLIDRTNMIEDDYITSLTNFAINNYNKDPTKRIHFIDIRNSIGGFETFVSFADIINLLYNIDNFKNDINLFDFFCYYNNEINKFLNKLFIYINNYDKQPLEYDINLPYYLVDIINKTNPELLCLLFPITKKYLDNYYMYTNVYIGLTNLDQLTDVYHTCRLALTAINDLYAILCILNNDDINNIIIYVGAAHTQFYLEYLDALNIKLLKHMNSSSENYRCINNIDDFIEFFEE